MLVQFTTFFNLSCGVCDWKLQKWLSTSWEQLIQHFREIIKHHWSYWRRSMASVLTFCSPWHSKTFQRRKLWRICQFCCMQIQIIMELRKVTLRWFHWCQVRCKNTRVCLYPSNILFVAIPLVATFKVSIQMTPENLLPHDMTLENSIIRVLIIKEGLSKPLIASNCVMPQPELQMLV